MQIGVLFRLEQESPPAKALIGRMLRRLAASISEEWCAFSSAVWKSHMKWLAAIQMSLNARCSAARYFVTLIWRRDGELRDKGRQRQEECIWFEFTGKFSHTPDWSSIKTRFIRAWLIHQLESLPIHKQRFDQHRHAVNTLILLLSY